MLDPATLGLPSGELRQRRIDGEQLAAGLIDGQLRLKQLVAVEAEVRAMIRRCHDESIPVQMPGKQSFQLPVSPNQAVKALMELATGRIKIPTQK